MSNDSHVSPVTTAWRVLRLWVEEKTSSYGGRLRISRREQLMSGPAALGFGVGLITPHRKNPACYRTSDLRCSCENGNEIQVP
jgi:hypothetical protein